MFFYRGRLVNFLVFITWANIRAALSATTLFQSDIEKATVELGKERFISDSLYLGNRSDILLDTTLSAEASAMFADALNVHPLEVWKLKHRYQSAADLGVDETQLYKFVDNERNDRLANQLFKVLKGEDVSLTVVGGSNCGGAGVQDDEGDAQGVFPRVLKDWWAKTITRITGSQLKLNLVSIGGTNSEFFQYCYHTYLDISLDLVILELSINDAIMKSCTALEQFTRQLLMHASQPALIYVNFFSGSTYSSGCGNLEDFGQATLSYAYNITTIRWRDLVCPITSGVFRKPIPDLDIFCQDKHHVNLRGHAQVSLILINLFRKVLLDFIVRNAKEPSPVSQVLPKPLYITATSNIVSDPLCWTTITPNYQNTTIKNNLQLTVVKNIQFVNLPPVYLGNLCDPPRVCRADAYSGWTGRAAGATLIISFVVPASPAEDKTRSVLFASRSCSYCGVAKVWLDNNFDCAKVVTANSRAGRTIVALIASCVTPGMHTISVEVVKSGDVTVAGVMLGPPDGP